MAGGMAFRSISPKTTRTWPNGWNLKFTSKWKRTLIFTFSLSFSCFQPLVFNFQGGGVVCAFIFHGGYSWTSKKLALDPQEHTTWGNGIYAYGPMAMFSHRLAECASLQWLVAFVALPGWKDVCVPLVVMAGRARNRLQQGDNTTGPSSSNATWQEQGHRCL